MADEKLATILFADLMNPRELATNLSLQEYDEMIVDFQNTMSLVTSGHLREFGYVGGGVDSEWSLAGEELCVFLYSGDLRFDIRNALLVAVKIKLGWLASIFNQKILMEGRPVSRLSVGIDYGNVIKDIRHRPVSMRHYLNPVKGHAIHSTKRIESVAREGTVYQVMAGESIHQFCREHRPVNVTFSQPRHHALKGFEEENAVYEVVSLINYEIVPSMPDSFRDRLQEVMEYAVVQPVPEPWVYFTLLRHYISCIIRGGREETAEKAVQLADQALGVLEYKKTLYNILGWLYAYCDRLRDPDKALQYFGQSLNIDPNDPVALIHSARIAGSNPHREVQP
jgi:class 3 adenylate cyclase